MKVKDLINQLTKFNPESTLLFSTCLESGRSFGGCSFESDHQITDMSKEEFNEEVENMELDLNDELLDSVDNPYGLVVLTVSGEENWNE